MAVTARVLVISRDDAEIDAREARANSSLYGSTPAYRPVLATTGGATSDELNRLSKAVSGEDG
jgi:hypothetical protein